MDNKKLIAYINSENELDKSIIKAAGKYSSQGVDELFIYNYSKDEESREEFFHVLKEIKKEVPIPIMAGLSVERFDHIKKAFYAGAEKIVVKEELAAGKEAVIEEGIRRFGPDKFLMEIDSQGDFSDWEKARSLKERGFCGILLKHVEVSQRLRENMRSCPLPIIIRDSLIRNILKDLILYENVEGVATNYYRDRDIRKVKQFLKEEGIPICGSQGSLFFGDFKTGSDGLVPAVVQDYETMEVLMVAYMNQEAYEKTLETGQMHYFSRSRQSLWHKGETSGHYQYVKHLLIDCDNDTILAKVKQVGPACHTGKKSCFFTDLVKKSNDAANPFQVLQDVFQVIEDRKSHPKEGSYTTYLFEKGIDKILKKCGEEAAEIIIAAKNPDKEELTYEMADFLYHMMVLMAERGLKWEDVAAELSQRK